MILVILLGVVMQAKEDIGTIMKQNFTRTAQKSMFSHRMFSDKIDLKFDTVIPLVNAFLGIDESVIQKNKLAKLLYEMIQATLILGELKFKNRYNDWLQNAVSCTPEERNTHIDLLKNEAINEVLSQLLTGKSVLIQLNQDSKPILERKIKNMNFAYYPTLGASHVSILSLLGLALAIPIIFVASGPTFILPILIVLFGAIAALGSMAIIASTVTGDFKNGYSRKLSVTEAHVTGFFQTAEPSQLAVENSRYQGATVSNNIF